MKNSNLLRYAAILSFFAILIAGCSKDSLSKPKANTNSGNINTPARSDTDPFDQLPGSIQAVVRPPEYTISMVVYNANFTSNEYFADPDGYVVINDLDPGIYTAVIHNYNTDLPDIIVDNVNVSSGKITDLGKISCY